MFFHHMMSNAAAKSAWAHLRFKGAQKWSRQWYTVHYVKTAKTLKFNICLPYPTVNSRITLTSMFFHHRTSDVAAMMSGVISGAAKNNRGDNTKTAKWKPAYGPIFGKGTANTQSSLPPTNSLNHPSHFWTTNTRGDPKLTRPCLNSRNSPRPCLNHVPTTSQPRLNHVWIHV